MNTWPARIDHLAEHFKSGKSMADWNGSLGFEPEVQELVENSIPPCKLHSSSSNIVRFAGYKFVDANNCTDLIHSERIALTSETTPIQVDGEVVTSYDSINIDETLLPMIQEPSGEGIQSEYMDTTNNNITAQQSPEHQSERFAFRDEKDNRRLEVELTRFVSSCFSQFSPNPHFPSDEEIRRQARIIIYNDDSPWNTTAADNAGWFSCFKSAMSLTSVDQSSPEPVMQPPWQEL